MPKSATKTAAEDSKKQATVFGAGLGMIFGAALGSAAIGLVFGAASGLVLAPFLSNKFR